MKELSFKQFLNLFKGNKMSEDKTNNRFMTRSANYKLEHATLEEATKAAQLEALDGDKVYVMQAVAIADPTKLASEVEVTVLN